MPGATDTVAMAGPRWPLFPNVADGRVRAGIGFTTCGQPFPLDQRLVRAAVRLAGQAKVFSNVNKMSLSGIWIAITASIGIAIGTARARNAALPSGTMLIFCTVS